MSDSNRVSGHTLRCEGAAFDEKGRRISWRTTGGEGRAKCSCGELSHVMFSANRRKQWHRDHKASL